MSGAFPPEALGITSTIPLEIPLAAGKRVFDLNNRFILSSHPEEYVRLAEREGFPRTCCAWIRGLYGYIRSAKVKRVIFVTGGDCSNTHAMMETLLPELEEIHTFSFPFNRTAEDLRRELERFCQEFGTDLAAAGAQNRKLGGIRADLAELDRLTWEEPQIRGEENQQWLLSASDFEGDPEGFGTRLRGFLDEARRRPPLPDGPRIGVLGVPPIQTDLHAVIEGLGGRVVFNEIPRQFALLGSSDDLVRQYLDYTYPYGAGPRLGDIAAEARRRRLDGLIHYTQAFCHRQIHDILLRRESALPTLTLEGEQPGPCDARTILRLESFLEILTHRRKS